LVDGDAIDDLLGLLLGLGQRIAQDGRIERRAGFVDQLLPGLFQRFRRDLFRLDAGFPGRAFGNRIRIDGLAQGIGKSDATSRPLSSALRFFVSEFFPIWQSSARVDSDLVALAPRHASRSCRGDGGFFQRARVGLVALAYSRRCPR
jgi:hypothetical protein